MRLKLFALTIFVLALSQLAFGTTLLIPGNYGFDERTTYASSCTAPACIPDQFWNTDAPPDWTLSGTGGDYKSDFGTFNGNPGFIDPLTDPNVGWLEPGSYMYQTLPVNLTIGETYMFGYFVGRRAEVVGASYRLFVTAGTTGPFTEGVNMWTVAGTTTTIPGFATMYGWKWDQVQFTPDAASAAFAGVPLTVWAANDAGEQLNLDYVPEPSTMSLFGIGLALVASCRLRRR